MLISHKQLEVIARKNGYEDARDYAQDHDMSRCEYCGRWGKHGEEVFEAYNDSYCDEHRPVEAE